jgi:drug/metabolite transporter (DMT)-like permease
VLLATLAGTGLVAFNVCVIRGAQYGSPAMVGTTIAAVPLVLALLSPWLSGRRPAAAVVVGAVVVVAGAATVNGWGSGSATGVLYSLGALACEVCFSLLALPLLPRLGPRRVSGYAAALAAPMFLLVGLIADGSRVVRTPTVHETLAYAYLVIVVTVGAFLMWYFALPRLGPDRVGLFAGALPVGAVVTTALLGYGAPSMAEVLGTGLVVAGILVGFGWPMLRSLSRPSPLSGQAAQHRTQLGRDGDDHLIRRSGEPGNLELARQHGEVGHLVDPK